MEDAARGRVGGAGHVALQDLLVLDALVANARNDIEKRLGVGVQGLVEELLLARQLHGVAEVHDHDRVGDVLDHGEIVADEDVGQAKLVLQLLKQVDDLCLHGDVQGRDGLVADDDLRLKHDGSGDADALALAAGELVRVAVLEGQVQTHGLHDLLDAGIALCAGLVGASNVDGLGNDVGHSHARVEGAVRVLEDELHLLAGAREVLALELGEVFAVEDDLAGGGLGQAQDALAGGGLSAAGLAHDGEGLSAVDLKGGVLQRVHAGVGLAEDALLDRVVLGEVLDLEDDVVHVGVLAHRYSPHSSESNIQQATVWFSSPLSGETCGHLVRHTSLAYGHLGWNGQPLGSSFSMGTLPGMA